MLQKGFQYFTLKAGGPTKGNPEQGLVSWGFSDEVGAMIFFIGCGPTARWAAAEGYGIFRHAAYGTL